MARKGASGEVEDEVAYSLLYNNITNSMGKKTIVNLKAGLRDILELKELIENRDSSIKTVRKRWEKIKESSWPDFYTILSKIAPTPPGSPDSGSDPDSEAESSASASSKSSSSSSSSKPGSKKSKKSLSQSTLASKSSVGPSSSSSSSSSSESETESPKAKKSLKANKKLDAKSSSSDSDSGTESDDEAESDADEVITPKVVANGLNNKKGKDSKTKAKSVPDSKPDSHDDSSSSEEEPQPKKKRRTDENGTAVPVVEKKVEKDVKVKKVKKNAEASPSVEAKVEVEAPHTTAQNGSAANEHDSVNGENGVANGPKRPRKEPRQSNGRFQRIKVDQVQYEHERLKDNSYDSKGGINGDYGARASRDLIVTRGDGFRKEKNKKKRGSYRGGEITLETHSIKF